MNKKKYKEIRLTNTEFSRINLLMATLGEKFPDFFWSSVDARLKEIKSDNDISSIRVKNVLYNLFGDIDLKSIRGE